MFESRKFRDEVGFIAAGIGSASFSVSTQVSSMALVDLSKYRKFIFAMYANSTQYGNKTLQLYSISTSASSISSASSNWISMASVSCVMQSSLASGSASQYCAFMEARGEYFNSSNASPIRYVRAVATCGSGVSSSSTDVINLAIFGITPHFGPASLQEPNSAIITSEVDLL